MLIGTKVRLTAEWRVPARPDGTLTDPTTVSLLIRTPDGVQTTYTFAGGDITKDATGQYHYDITPTTTGKHTWRWVGTGAAHAPAEGAFNIEPSRA